jgi:molecular chaperone GrpE
LNEVESEQEDGMVINEIQKGYMLNDRLLRPALVSISKKKSNTN